MGRGWSRITAGWLSTCVVLAGAVGAESPASKAVATRGRAVYVEHCAGCHGAGGDGKGFARVLETIRPPDFTRGEARYRSTPPGAPPTDADLSRSIVQGVRRTSMPHHNFLDEAQRRAVVAYVRSFYPQWAAPDGDVAPVTLPPKPQYLGSAASRRRGAAVFAELGCAACHGADGRGDGPAARLPPDARGLPQTPIDLSAGGYKGGGRLDDVFRTLVIGLDGTAMGAHAEQLLRPDGERLLPGDGWHLAWYLVNLGRPDEPPGRTAGP